MDRKKSVLIAAGCLLLLYGIGCASPSDDKTDPNDEQQQEQQTGDKYLDKNKKLGKGQKKETGNGKAVSPKTGKGGKNSNTGTVGTDNTGGKGGKGGKGNKKKKVKKIIKPGKLSCKPVGGDAATFCTGKLQVPCGTHAGICAWTNLVCGRRALPGNVCSRYNGGELKCKAVKGSTKRICDWTLFRKCNRKDTGGYFDATDHTNLCNSPNCNLTTYNNGSGGNMNLCHVTTPSSCGVHLGFTDEAAFCDGFADQPACEAVANVGFCSWKK